MNEELVIQIRAEISDLKKQVSQATKQIKGIGTDGSKSVNKLNDTLKTLGKTIATVFSVKAITDFTKEIINCSAEVMAEESAFTQIMGTYADEASKKMSKIADATGVVDSRLTTYMTSMTAKFKGLGYGIEEATDLATQGLNMAIDASAFWDMSLDEATSHLNSFINGSYEGGEAIGLFANDTQMAMYAVESGVINSTKAWKDLDEATKQATRLEYAQAMMDLSGATGQASKEADSFANVQANLNEKWRQFKADIGEPVLQNIAVPGMELLSGAIDSASQAYENFCAWLPTGKAYFEELGLFVEETFAPTFAILSPIFEEVNGFLSPLVEKVKEYITEGGLATDANNLLHDAISLVGDICEDVATIISDFVDMLKDLKQWVADNEDAITLLGIAVGTLTTAIIAYNVAQMIANAGGITAIATNAGLTVGYYALVVAENLATIASTAFGAVMAFITSPITLVIVAIGALIAIIVACVKNWDEIKETVSSVVGSISEKVSNMKNKVIEGFNGITDKIDNAKEKIKDAIEKIKGFFNFKFSWPSIPMPHFSITPTGWKVGDLLKGDIPKLGISWYAEGGVFDKPTLFGYGNGMLGGLGENGAEAVVPLEKNTEWLDRIAERLAGKQSTVVLEVDGKVFGEVSVNSINALTRQKGSLPLVFA